jgi:RNA polymerase sigma factor (sigma-70 family)
MVNGQLGVVLRYVRALAGPGAAAPMSDGQLLNHFLSRRDETAFAALVERHGPMVHGVCRRLLRRAQDVDDVFQATFLVLIERAGSIARADSVGSWLYGVAYRLAMRVRANARKRQQRERPIIDPPQAPGDAPIGLREMRHVLDEELRRLPEKYRAPLVLHYLSGRTKAETAQDLGWTEGTVSGRLARGRQLLRARLTRRGVALAGLLAACGVVAGRAPAAVPAALRDATVKGAVGFAAGVTAGAGHAADLARGLLRGFFLTKVQVAAGLVVALGVLAGSAALIASQAPPRSPPPGPAEPPAHRLAADVPCPEGEAESDGRMGLPPEAVVRLGTTRGRHVNDLSAIALSPDGKLLATRAGDDRVRLWDAATGRERYALGGGHDKPGLWCFAFAPGGELATGGADGAVRFWDPATGRELRHFVGDPEGVRSVGFSGDGKLLVVGGEDNEVVLWDAANGKEVRRLGQAGGPLTAAQAKALSPLRDVFFCPGDKAVAVAYLWPYRWPPVRALELWDVGKERDKDRPPRRFDVPVWQGPPPFSADGKSLVCVGPTGQASLRAVDTGRELRAFGAEPMRWARAVALSPDGRTLAIATADGVELWETSMGTKLRALADSGNSACLAFSRDGKALAAGAYDGTFQLWDTATGAKLLRPLSGHPGPVGCVASSPDGKALATCCTASGTIRLWQASTGREIRRWAAHGRGGDGPQSLAYSPDGKTLASAGGDRMVRLWDAATGREVSRFSGRRGLGPWQPHLRFSPDGQLLATGDADGTVCLWTAAGREVRCLQEGNSAWPPRWDLRVSALAFSPDGKSLAGSQGSVIRLWNVADGKEVRRLAADTGDVTALAFSPDGKSLATAGAADVVSLWEVATGKESRRLTGGASPSVRLHPEGYRFPHEPGTFNSLGFAPDGQTLLAGRDDGGVYVWDVSADRPAHKVYGHKEAVTCLAVSGDGKTVASASADRTVLVWDLAALRQALRDRAP